MDTTLLTRRSGHTIRASLQVLNDMALIPARLHELCGPSRHMLAMLVAAKTKGPVFWIAPTWSRDRLNPDGMQPLVGPERFTFLSPRQPMDLLWTLEETLRSGTVPLAVAELTEIPNLTQVRRLHLAAEQGAKNGGDPPLGLILTAGEDGTPGVESRWHMRPAHTAQNRRWSLSRRRARTLPPATWGLYRNNGQFMLTPDSTEQVDKKI